MIEVWQIHKKLIFSKKDLEEAGPDLVRLVKKIRVDKIGEIKWLRCSSIIDLRRQKPNDSNKTWKL